MKKNILKVVALALIAVMTCAILVACAPASDPDKALDALKENGIDWAAKDTLVIPTALKLLGVDGIDSVVSGTGKIDDEFAHVTIIYFEDKDDANDAWEKVQKYSDEKKDDEAEDWVCKKSGKMIYFGTENAIKAAR